MLRQLLSSHLYFNEYNKSIYCMETNMFEGFLKRNINRAVLNSLITEKYTLKLVEKRLIVVHESSRINSKI